MERMTDKMKKTAVVKFDEIQELKKMFCQKKKPMLLLINKSDVKEKDEVDGKIVTILKAKSAENRKTY